MKASHFYSLDKATRLWFGKYKFNLTFSAMFYNNLTHFPDKEKLHKQNKTILFKIIFLGEFCTNVPIVQKIVKNIQQTFPIHMHGMQTLWNNHNRNHNVKGTTHLPNTHACNANQSAVAEKQPNQKTPFLTFLGQLHSQKHEVFKTQKACCQVEKET